VSFVGPSVKNFVVARCGMTRVLCLFDVVLLFAAAW